MFFSKRACNALSSCSRCSGDKFFLLLFMFRPLVGLIVVASRISHLLLRCARPHIFSAHISVNLPRTSSVPRGGIARRRWSVILNCGRPQQLREDWPQCICPDLIRLHGGME